MIGCIETRFSGWNNQSILWGRPVLLKCVFSLPIYFLSFFKTPTCIISSIKSIFDFFLGEKYVGLIGTEFL